MRLVISDLQDLRPMLAWALRRVEAVRAEPIREDWRLMVEDIERAKERER